jgi:hypothetical protein
LGRAALKDSSWRWLRFQVGYGLILGAFVLVSCHLPMVSWFIQAFSRSYNSKAYNPSWDVTHDLYGWSEVRPFLKSILQTQKIPYPTTGSWYQTAAQAAFYVSEDLQFTRVPSDIKEKDEWPVLQGIAGEGTGWPVLKQTVLFFSDNRYRDEPHFLQSECRVIARFEKKRFHLLAKWIDIWRCDPIHTANTAH